MSFSSKLSPHFPKIRMIVAIFLLGSLMACVFISMNFVRTMQAEQAEHQATREVVDQITDDYGAEATAVIENLELKQLSIDSYLNPESLADIGTGPYLDEMKRRLNYFLENNKWHLVEEITVTRLIIHEYSSEHFKASACSDQGWKDIEPDGTLIKLQQVNGLCSVYVFVRENETWKLAGFFSMNRSYSASYRDWQFLPPWLGEIMGEFPDSVLIRERE